MIGICLFCCQNKELTNHHIIAQSYNGTDDAENLIKDICRECHDRLENKMNEVRGQVGAGRTPQQLTFTIGQTSAQILTGSILLGNNATGFIDAGSPIFGMRCHNQIIGERYLEATISGGNVIMMTGSPSNSWVIYAIAKPI
ncbi:MAG: HNH endonuclease [Candidatus Woesearchaeota archaeon]|nr:HNH endonuclease [Candidatus Woesearchaeota archaeon]